MKTMSWTGSKGNEIELRASCVTKMVERELSADGFVYGTETKPYTDANLELWADGKLVDSCRNTNFWRIIDAGNGIKKVWGLKVGMTAERAAIVEAFLTEVIESGKTEEVREHEAAEVAAEKAAEIKTAQKTIELAEKEPLRNGDGSLLTEAQVKAWKRRYNDINNEGGEGFVPDVITQEELDAAKAMLAKHNVAKQ